MLALLSFLVILLSALTTQQPLFGNCPNYPIPVPLSPSNPELQNAFKQLDMYLTDQLSQEYIPGMVAVVVYDQEIVWSNGYGKQNPFDPKSPAPTLDSVVQVASITKTFTDLMMFKLRDEGIVNLDQSVQSLIPEFSMKNPYNTNRPVTLRQLASHSAGLPREIPCDWLSLCTKEEILANLTAMSLILPPYTTPHYSNLGIALLGRALEVAANTTYEEYVLNNILWPLNMTSSNFNYTNLSPNTAIGEALLLNGTYVEAPILDSGWGNPMGGLLSSARDMAKYMSFLFRDNETPNNGNQIIDGSTIRELLTPVIQTRTAGSAFGSAWEFYYDTNNSVWLRMKGGQFIGYRSQIALVPEIKLGIFITVTCGNTDDSQRSIFTIPSMNILLPAFMEALWAAQPVQPLPSNYKSFIGLYRLTNTIYNTMDYQVWEQGGKLYGSYTFNNMIGQQVNLAMEGPTVFRATLTEPEACRWQDDGIDQELVYFTLSSNGTYSEQIVLSGEVFYFVSQNCPSCN